MKKLGSVLLVVFCLLLVSVASADNVFRFQEKKISLFEGEQIQVPLLREGTAEEGVPAFKTASPKLLSVDEDGFITGLSKGNGKVTATLKTEKRTFTAELSVTVLRRVTEVTVDEKSLTVYDPADPVVAPYLQESTENPVILLRVGANSQRVNMTALPSDASNRKTALRSLDEKIVRVTGDALNYLRPVSAGECDVEAYSVQNPEVSVTYHVLVAQPVQSVSIDADSTMIAVGGTAQLTASVSPADATVQEVIWTSGNPKIATVDEYGTVTGVKRGEVYIKATAADGSGRSRSVQVTVAQMPEVINLKTEQMEVKVNRTVKPTWTVEPTNANNRQVTWSSSDTHIATVDQSGNIRGVRAGTCYVTCACKVAPEVTATLEVNVIQPVTRIQFLNGPVTVDVGSSTVLEWMVMPEDATYTSVKLTSNNPKVATVTSDGTVLGLKRGSATITATAEDGSRVTGTVKVNVLQPVTGAHMKYDLLHVDIDNGLYATLILEPSDASNTNVSWSTTDPSIATASGKSTKVRLTGRRQGTTTVIGTTEDGGYTGTATVLVDFFDRAIRIQDLYIQNNKIRLTLKNNSNMNLTRVYFRVECFDIYGEPTLCNINGGTAFNGSYRYELRPGDHTEHGSFTFSDFVQPPDLHGVRVYITGYQTDDGYSRNIEAEKQPMEEYFFGILPKPTATPELDLG